MLKKVTLTLSDDNYEDNNDNHNDTDNSHAVRSDQHDSQWHRVRQWQLIFIHKIKNEE